MERNSERIVRAAELEKRLGVSKPTLWRMRRRGEIPEPIRISRGVVGWRESTIAEWLDDRPVVGVTQAGA